MALWFANYDVNIRTERDFLNSNLGNLFHEIGHYSAANFKTVAIGHIIIGPDRAAGAAFVVSEPWRSALFADVDNFKLTAAGGAIVEWFGVKNTEFSRVIEDIKMVNKYYSKWNFDPDDKNMGQKDFQRFFTKWMGDYRSVSNSIVRNTRHNFDRIHAGDVTSIYKIGDYIVLPSHELSPITPRKAKDFEFERDITSSYVARKQALDEFLVSKKSMGANAHSGNSVQGIIPRALNFIRRFI